MPDTRTDTVPPSQDWHVIHAYTRGEALADGVLVDVTATAKEAGFKVPTAVTASVFNECIEWTEEGRQAEPDLPGPGRTPLGRPVPRRRQGPPPSAAGARTSSCTNSASCPGPATTTRASAPSSSSSAPATTPNPVATIMLPNED